MYHKREIRKQETSLFPVYSMFPCGAMFPRSFPKSLAFLASFLAFKEETVERKTRKEQEARKQYDSVSSVNPVVQA